MVVRTAVKTELHRSISRSRGRFISILLVVMLGVAFFSGIRSSEPDMRLTGDSYFDRTHMYDGRIVSTMGLTDEDVEDVMALGGVETAEGIHSIDVLSGTEDDKKAFHVLNIPESLNDVNIEEGRMPENDRECLVDAELKNKMGLSLGNTLKLESGNDDLITDSLKYDTYTIVGFASSPVYISFDRGYTTIGTGSLYGFIYVPDSAFSMDYYTEIDYSLSGAESELIFTDGYDEISAAGADEAEGIADERSFARYYSLRTDACDEIKDAQRELAEAKADALRKLNDAAVELSDNEQKLSDAADTIANGRSAISSARATLDEKQNELNSAVDTYNSGQEALASAKEQLADTETKYNMMQQDPTADPAVLAQISAGIAAAKTEIDTNEAALAAAASQISTGQSEISSGYAEIENQEAALDSAQAELDDGMQELANGRTDYETSRQEAIDEIEKAKKEINEGKEKINEIDKPEWTVYERSDDTDYMGYGDNAERMKNIGQVFPFVFFLVAALISLTMMTRMVEEERVQIGTMKALGYTRAAIAGKYLKYALLATAIGSVGGVLIGEQIFPRIIISSYGIMYHYITDTIVPYNIYYGLMASGAAIVSTLAAVLISCYAELTAVPAELMRPPSPKKGKRILLEMVTLLWKHLSFSWKSTLRNLARYKQRFYMTVFGIGGSMALLLSGFGLRDSIMGVVTIQYDEVQLYDADLYLADDLTEEQLSNIEKKVNNLLGPGNYIESSQKSVDVDNGSKKVKATLLVPSDLSTIESFVALRDRVTGTKYTMNDDGVILTEKAASLLSIKAGDTITIKGDTDKTVTVTAVCENYMNHYVYMTPSLYEKLYGAAPEYDDIMLRMDNVTLDETEEVGSQLLKEEGTLSVNYLAMLEDKVSDMLSVLDKVIVVLTISAGMLTFIVLYSLNSINIAERKRELATIKVLGFYDIELAEYIYRENVLLTIVGMVIGVGFGILLHRYLITTVEIDTVMFGRNIEAFSFVKSIILTGVFAAIVNWVMYFRLKKIDMVESLKSIE